MLPLATMVAAAFLDRVPASPIAPRCQSPSTVGDIFPGRSRRDSLVVRHVLRIEDQTNSLVGWEYDTDHGARFVQPLPGMSPKDGALLRISIPRVGVGRIYPLSRLPGDLHGTRCR